MKKVEQMKPDDRYENEMFEVRSGNLEDPSIYESEHYADYHSPFLCENEEMMKKQLRNIIDAPEDSQDCLGWASLTETYSKLYNAGLKNKNLHQDNEYKI